MNNGVPYSTEPRCPTCHGWRGVYDEKQDKVVPCPVCKKKLANS